MRRLFIADLHLNPARPEHSCALIDFCQQRINADDELYILGDLFDAWIGDDVGIITYADVIACFKQLTTNGTQVFFMAGNRDFLIGNEFSQATGVQLLVDPTVVTFEDQDVLLMHGDTLCTDDIGYQNFRSLVRNSSWQSEFLAMSPALRMQQATDFRQQSQAMTAMKSDEIMDVNLHAVTQVMDQHQVSLLIHGHTHRPQVHHLNQGERVVLGDWGGHFDYLSWPQGEAWHLIRESI
ncbi:MAG: UDP-2,3-diacylglucosamine hydrolase [Candidatus Paceibacteria bacterium]|jgi:UDP-2,3-diacylglucosamine hydrolase|tara:strand:- start:173 stop:886 length:714 start_codon:yes stop_codon:yes gene_type:complete